MKKDKNWNALVKNLKSGKTTLQALALVYFFCLDDVNRKRYSKRITPTVFGRVSWFNNKHFTVVSNGAIEELCSAFEMPPGVASHQSLKEDLFISFIMTKTPLILVGRVRDLGLPVQTIHII